MGIYLWHETKQGCKELTTAGMPCIVLAWLKIKENCSLEVAETNSVVVEILKLVLAGNQVRDKLVNVNKMPTNLEGGVVESAFFGVFLPKKNCWTVIFTCIEDCRIISRGITEIKVPLTPKNVFR